jgi:hypothetical protein
MSLLEFTVISIGLFGISIASTVEDVFAGKKKEYCNTEGNTATISVKDFTENVVTESNVVTGIQDVNR